MGQWSPLQEIANTSVEFGSHGRTWVSGYGLIETSGVRWWFDGTSVSGGGSAEQLRQKRFANSHHRALAPTRLDPESIFEAHKSNWYSSIRSLRPGGKALSLASRTKEAVISSWIMKLLLERGYSVCRTTNEKIIVNYYENPSSLRMVGRRVRLGTPHPEFESPQLRPRLFSGAKQVWVRCRWVASLGSVEKLITPPGAPFGVAAVVKPIPIPHNNLSFKYFRYKLGHIMAIPTDPKVFHDPNGNPFLEGNKPISNCHNLNHTATRFFPHPLSLHQLPHAADSLPIPEVGIYVRQKYISPIIHCFNLQNFAQSKFSQLNVSIDFARIKQCSPSSRMRFRRHGFNELQSLFQSPSSAIHVHHAAIMLRPRLNSIFTLHQIKILKPSINQTRNAAPTEN
ncbi:hypothetical protein IEQ34_009595 [Dendrobium chrysotoxum]|uniref:Uncharacterized protein n=1 Tax=Dendrobium chrysotoxum TaxID=161865 RepID=A0AAV7H3A4_DENCH|nr:hypothetical protein IEQ34_009595 [Dendrobium chrysotoxum]